MMNNKRTCYPAPLREGACSKDVWTIYNMLPDNTNFTLEFYDAAARGEALERIDFKKCGDPTDPMTVEDHTDQMKEAFRRFGCSGYWNVQLEWRRGFGNAALVRMVLDRPRTGAGGEVHA